MPINQTLPELMAQIVMGMATRQPNRISQEELDAALNRQNVTMTPQTQQTYLPYAPSTITQPGFDQMMTRPPNYIAPQTQIQQNMPYQPSTISPNELWDLLNRSQNYVAPRDVINRYTR
jgi:hypothetical protein